MRRKVAQIVVILSLIALLALIVASASAQSTKTYFEAEEQLAPVGPPGKVWGNEDGIEHIRDLPVAGPVWGDLAGTLSINANINWDATGTGTAYGTAILDVEWNGKTGTFEGRSQWKYAGFVVADGQFVGHGTGDFAGMQMKADFYATGGGVAALVGTINDPHGG